MDKPRHSQNIGTEESVETKRLLHDQHQNEEDLQDQRTQVDQPTQSSEPQRILLWAMLFYGMGALLPCGVILTDMDFFISSLPTHHPEFVYNKI